MQNVLVGSLVVVLQCLLFAPAAGAEPSVGSSKGNSPSSRGLPEKREAWTTSRFIGSPDPAPQFECRRRYPHLSFQRPVAITRFPGQPRLVVVENKGPVRSFVDRDSTAAADVMIDLSREVEGYWRSYGIAFHPQFAENRHVFLCYVLDKGNPEGTRVSRFRVTSTDPPRIDPGSERILLTWPSGGHNGGCLKFGPDGYLYISAGDGANPSPPDPERTGQDIRDLTASILRIDVDRAEGGRPYSIPPDNPFVHLEEARPEVWAFGFRNPWKMSFDPFTDDLWVGDVGWELWEMVQRVESGGNYGWSVREGRQPVNSEAPIGPTPLRPPVVALPHTVSRSVTGGITYRGGKHRQLQGAYIYGDYVTGKLWSLTWKKEAPPVNEELADSSLQVIAFGEDSSGELLVLDYAGGIYALEESDKTGPNKAFPQRLSDSGLFADTHSLAPARGVLPYSIRAQPWADGARAERLIGVPDLKRLGIHQTHNVQMGTIRGEWDFPSGTVLAKTLSLPVAGEQNGPPSQPWRPVETQILHRDEETWRAYSYRWNDEASDAELVPVGGVDRTYRVVDPAAPSGFRRQTWHFAGRTECLVCHTTRAGSIHGFNRRQMQKPHEYGGVVADQLAMLEKLGLFQEPVQYDQPPMSSPWDEQATLERRARAYLHINCAHCHRRGGGGNAPFVLLEDLELEELGILEARPTQGTFGIHDAAVVAPGRPEQSVMMYRLLKLGPGRMPYAGSNRIDARGVKLVGDWIASLAGKDETRPTTVQRRAAAALKRLKSASAGAAGMKQDVAQLLSSTSGAMQLLWLVDSAPREKPLRKIAVASASAHPDARVRDLFERFLPEDQRVKRLGASIDPQSILRLEGDAREGRKMFFSSASVQCKSCHKIGSEGGNVGPELSRIGKKLDRRQLLQAIAEPSKDIDPKFLTYLVETSDGLVFRGLLSSRNDVQVVLIDPQGKLRRISQENIDFMAPQQTSLMPDLMLKDMTAQQVADLLAYLSTLR